MVAWGSSGVSGGCGCGWATALALALAVVSAVAALFLQPPSSPPTPASTSVYGVMLDAGSTGSRVHVYRFRAATTAAAGANAEPAAALPELEDEVLAFVHPGLSSFTGRPADAAASLAPLIDVALSAVPPSERAHTPIALKATAGLRLLGADDADAILAAVRAYLATTPFYCPPDAVEILDGAREGLYAWITVNLLDGRLGQPTKLPTAGIMDLGGASTQIVFEPKDAHRVMSAGPEANQHSLTLGGHTYLLYLHSHLGFGLLEARKALLDGDDGSAHPCLPSPLLEFGSCHATVTTALRLDAPCATASCSFNGVFQPEADAIPDDLYIFSFFFDRAQEARLAEAITLSHYHDAAQAACASNAADGPLADAVAKNPHLCMDLTFMFALLRDGVGLAPDRRLRLTKKIRGIETGWCLGATIHMLDQHKHHHM